MAAELAELLKQARALGESIGAQPRTRAFLDAQEKLRGDAAAQKLLADYRQHVEKLQRLEMEQRPIEVDDKRRMADLESRIAQHETLKTLMRSQADYFELMNQVNAAIEEPVFGSPAARPD